LTCQPISISAVKTIIWLCIILEMISIKSSRFWRVPGAQSFET
jgi:hypothetical protein